MKTTTLLQLAACIFLAYTGYNVAFQTSRFVDNELASLLDEHIAELHEKIQSCQTTNKKKHGVWQFSWLPHYFVKYNIERIYGMKKMNKCIKKYHLDQLFVPDKKLYHLKDQPLEINNKHYLVIVKQVFAHEDKQALDIKQAQQLCTLIKQTGYISLSRPNYIITSDDKVALIDTEGTFNLKRTLTGLIRLLAWNHNPALDYTQDALNYILDEIIEVSSSTDNLNDTYREVLSILENIESPVKESAITYFTQRWQLQPSVYTAAHL